MCLDMTYKWSSGNFAAPAVFDQGDLHLARGSQDPNATAEPNFGMEDAGAIAMAAGSNFDKGDYDLLQGCEDPGAESVYIQIDNNDGFRMRG